MSKEIATKALLTDARRQLDILVRVNADAWRVHMVTQRIARLEVGCAQ